MSLTHITNHKEQMLARLLFEYKDKPNITKIITVLAARYQGMEDVLWQLATLRYIDTAEGVQLDIIGKILKQERGDSADDAEYRLRLRARMRANQSSGVPEDILSVFQALLGSYEHLKLTPYYPAGLLLRIDDLEVTDALASLYADFLFDAKLGGVAAWLQTSPAPDDETFCCPASTTLTADHDGESTMHVVSTAGFLPSGQLLFDVGDTIELRISYEYKTATTFEGCLERDGAPSNRGPGSLVVQNNEPASELTSALDVTSDVSLTVVDASLFPDSGFVTVGPLYSEATYRVLEYTSKSGNQLLGLSDTFVGGETLFLAGKIVALAHQGFGVDGESFGGQLSRVVEV